MEVIERLEPKVGLEAESPAAEIAVVRVLLLQLLAEAAEARLLRNKQVLDTLTRMKRHVAAFALSKDERWLDSLRRLLTVYRMLLARTGRKI